MFGHRFFGAAFYGPRYFGGNGTIIVVQPEPEQPRVISSGGRPERPLPPPRPRPKPLICEIVSGQGSQSVNGRLSFRVSGVVRTENREQKAAGELGMALEGAATSRQAQHVKGHAWPSMRAAVRTRQSYADTSGHIALDLVSSIKSGVVPQPVPTYTGKPLPKIFLTEPERKWP